MKTKLFFAVALLSLALTGCARRYTMTLNNGNRMTVYGKPQLIDGSTYRFKSRDGKVQTIPAGRVREISAE